MSAIGLVNLEHLCRTMDTSNVQILHEQLNNIQDSESNLSFIYNTLIINEKIDHLLFVADYFQYKFFDFENVLKTASTADALISIDFLLNKCKHLSENIDDDIYNAFEWAVSMDARKSVRYFVEHNHVDLSDIRNGAVFLSACEGHMELMQYFLSLNAAYDLDKILSLSHISKDTKAYFKTIEQRKKLYHSLDATIAQHIDDNDKNVKVKNTKI